MEYWTSYVTDIGTYRRTNQDALLLKTAKTSSGTVLLAAIADGVGGLKCGELASNTMIHDLAEWFERKLPLFIKSNNWMETAKETLLAVLHNTHTKLHDYTQKQNIQLGTTIALLFLFQNQYLIIHVGDTRVYQYDMHEMYQLTKDHTYVQREIDAGRMTREEAKDCGHEHILTQCIGSSSRMMPDIQIGIVNVPAIFLICSDGFRNAITNTEIKKTLEDAGSCIQNDFDQIPKNTVNLIKKRGEKDNISALFVKCCQEAVNA